jgi:hypothetical protein
VGTKIKYALVILLAMCSLAYGADVARQVDFLASGLEQDGNALSGGKVYTYEAGTTTAKTCYINRSKANKAANPVILSSEGRYTLFCDGVYKMVITDSSDVTLVTMDGITYGEEGLQTATLSSYGSLAEAVADIGSTKTVLIIDTTDTLNANVTVPSNITLVAMTRDAITLNAKTLTMNGDIWAGAFEWIIGTGTFAGSPVVQFYDPTWTASTVTDSATPSYKNLTMSEPTLLTPVIADFSNATHIHNGASQGGGTLTDVIVNGASLINTTDNVYIDGAGVLTYSNFTNTSDGSVTITASPVQNLVSLNMGTASVGDIVATRGYVTATKGGTDGNVTVDISPAGLASSLAGTGTSIGVLANVTAGSNWGYEVFDILQVTTGGTLTLYLQSYSDGSNSTSGGAFLGAVFLLKQ